MHTPFSGPQARYHRRFEPLVGRLLPAVLLLVALVAPLLGGSAPASAQAAQVQNWDSDTVAVTIQQDGSFTVSERQVFTFEQGTFHGSFRDIDTSRLSGISNVGVAEEGVGPYQNNNSPIDLPRGIYGPAQTFQVLSGDQQVRIIWFYGTLRAPASKTMVITYTVQG